MTSSVEIIHNNIIQSHLIISSAIRHLDGSSSKGKNIYVLSKLRWGLNKISDRYMCCASPYILKFYRDQSGATPDYFEFLMMSGVINVLNRCMATINDAVITRPKDLKLRKLVKDSCSFKIRWKQGSTDNDVCVCGVKMVICAETSDMKCLNCGMTRDMKGFTFDDNTAESFESQKIKNGRHKPETHYEVWISRIQAWDGPIVPPEIIDILRKSVSATNTTNNFLKCERIRRILKIHKQSSYNNIIPLIRKIFNGFSPPQLTRHELNVSQALFSKVARYLKEIRPENNIRYYPYIIYKIWDLILTNGRRKSLILECIHLQSVKTTRSIDIIWEQLCDDLNDKILIYRATDHHEYPV